MKKFYPTIRALKGDEFVVENGKIILITSGESKITTVLDFESPMYPYNGCKTKEDYIKWKNTVETRFNR